MRSQILIAGNFRFAQDDLQRLIAPYADITTLSATSRSAFFEDLQGPLANIVGIYHSNWSSSKIGLFDEELVSKLPSSVKWIAHIGAGYDQIDIAACKSRGITVSHTPGAVDDATATTALYLIIATCRQFTRGEKLLRDGSWKTSFPSAHDPSSRTLGILGLGGIGLRTAELARAFPMKVLYHSRKPAANAPDWAEYCPELSDFLAKTDVLSVHIPLNEQTAGLIGENEIRTLKKGSIIVNTARGGVIDEDALIRALEDGHLYAAGLDVFATEPNVDPRLLQMPNVTLLPHLGTSTKETQHGMEIRTLENLSSFLQGGKGKDIVPEMRD